MSLDVWFRDDIKNTLVALNQANGMGTARMALQIEEPREIQIYREGYRDALRAVAIAFGIATAVTLPEPLTENLRLTRTWKEVNYDDELDGA